MPNRPPQNQALLRKRLQDHVNVLRFLLDNRNLKRLATGNRLGTPAKLVVYFAGYIAMRRMWDHATKRGRIKTGDPELDKDRRKDPTSIIYRIDKEVAHPLGLQTSTLFVVAKFKFWGKRFLQVFAP